MIDDPFPTDWRELQSGVCRLFNEIGLHADVEVQVATPRGHTVVDVFATDHNSVDKITYIVECKNWSTSVPKSIVHAFTTVMRETGVNVGFIVSRHGLQSGAEEYTNHTNIVGLTYLELQERYFNIWWERHFCRTAALASDIAFQYVEPFNSRRERIVADLSPEARVLVRALQVRYEPFVVFIRVLCHLTMSPNYTVPSPQSIDALRESIAECLDDPACFRSKNYRELLVEVVSKCETIETEFNVLFGRNIFLDRK